MPRVSKSWTDEEVFKLIDLLEARPALWDPNNKDYSIRNIVVVKYKEIGEELGKEIAEIKEKVRGLRTSFNEQLKKKRQNKSGQSAAPFVTKWKYYEKMVFLECTFTADKTYSNLIPETEIIMPNETSSSWEENNTTPSNLSSSSSRNKRKNDSNDDAILNECVKVMRGENTKSSEAISTGNLVTSVLEKYNDHIQMQLRHAILKCIMDFEIEQSIMNKSMEVNLNDLLRDDD